MVVCTARPVVAALDLHLQPDCSFGRSSAERPGRPKRHVRLFRTGHHRSQARMDRHNVTMGPNVTIGGRSGLIPVPAIEDDVWIGAGACILGPVTKGQGAQIGANAVVLCDVPPGGTTAVGVPARALKALQRDER